MQMWRYLPVLLCCAALATPAEATSLRRASLEELVTDHRTIVVADVVDAWSYWSADGSFILTDVRLAPREVLKGDEDAGDLIVTLQGGTVGDLTTLIVGGPELSPGQTYVVFMAAQDLPGAPAARAVPYLVQGVFDVVSTPAGLRAVSQAAHHPLVPDAFGKREAPGGLEGLALDDLTRTVRRQVAPRRQPEVN